MPVLYASVTWVQQDTRGLFDTFGSYIESVICKETGTLYSWFVDVSMTWGMIILEEQYESEWQLLGLAYIPVSCGPSIWWCHWESVWILRYCLKHD